VAWGERAGWKHVEDIFDGGESGAKLDRAGVQRVIGLLRDERIDLVSFFKVDRVLNVQITALQEAREEHRKKALGLESLHTRATAKLASSPGEPGDLLAALGAQDRGRINDLLHRMAIHAEIDFGERDVAARRDGVKFVVRMPVPTDAEQYEGYLVQTS
jgi:hypothetical protein